MRRAFSLVLLVMMITIGVWYYLPSGSSTFVFYRQAFLEGAGNEPAKSVTCNDAAWQLSLEHIELTRRPSLSKLLPGAATTRLTLLLSQAANQEVATPPVLELALTDDLGKDYSSTSQQLKTLPSDAPTAQSAWEYVFVFPPLSPQVRSVTVYVQLDTLSFRFPVFPLP